MSEKRRDNRNRILREGEYQRKDGRYRFRYIDEDGKEKNVYSWRLDKNDPMPKGKKREPSLREKEKQIEADLFDRIVTNGGNYTVLELVEKYVSLKTGVRHNTVAGYKTVINMLKKESFGNLRIDKVRLSDADVDKALSYDVLALGCPAMGDEELEEGEFEPFFSDLEGKLSGKKVALFGSYDWGDGEWMRTWCGRAKDAGAELVEDEGLIVNNTPDDEGLAACRELGGKLA